MATSRQHTQNQTLSYLPGLDGLRALSVIAVLLYHADLPWIPGGFLGVEVFFVISGYLITSLLLAEWRQHGRINLKEFWLRRARRLLPAVYLLIMVTVAYAFLFLPREVASLRMDAMASVGYVTNWYLVFAHKSYFEAVGRPPLLRHLWSLAVEEQFYVFWPLLFVAGMRFLRHWRMLLATLVAIAASTALMAVLFQPDIDPSRIYYGTDTRAAGLLIGAALAFVWSPWQIPGQLARVLRLPLNIVCLASVGGLIWFFLRLDEFQPFLYQGGFLVVSLTTAIAIATAVHPQTQIGSNLLGWLPLRWVGVRSYGIYLWHWPLYMITRPQLDVAIDGLPLLALRLGATCVVAALSYRFVETPIRRGALGQVWQAWRYDLRIRRWWVNPQFAGAAAILASFVVFMVAVAEVPAPAPPGYLNFEANRTPTPYAERNPTEIPEMAMGLSLTPLSEAELTPTPDSPAPTMSEDELSATETAVAEDPSALEPTATPTRTPVRVGKVTAIGDSVMLGAEGELETSIGDIEVDAAVGRQVSTAIDVIDARRASGQLGELVVIHVGNNGTFTAAQFDEMMDVLKGVRRVVFLNVKVPRRWEEPNNTVLTNGVKRYPNAVLIDWRGATEKRPDLFGDDGIHLLPDGAQIYTEMIIGSLKTP